MRKRRSNQRVNGGGGRSPNQRANPAAGRVSGQVGIVVDGVSKTYNLTGAAAKSRAADLTEAPGGKLALQRIDLTVKPGEFVCLLGPSGCGKTTLLNIIGGLDRDYEGSVRFTAGGDGVSRGEEPTAAVPTIGYVFQEARLLPWMTVRDNVGFVLEGGRSEAKSGEVRDRVDDWLERVGLAGYGDYYPGQLSIGMQQRVAVARALIIEPQLLLMDEPLGSLDELTALRMRDELTNLWVDTDCTVVFVTHNPLEAVYLADRVVVMSPSPGRIVEQLDVTVHLPRPRASDDTAVWELSRRAVGLLKTAGEAGRS